MARTLPVFELDATTGQSAIYLVDPATPGDRQPFLNPAAFARFLLFHSGAQFLRVAYDQTKTLTLENASGKPGYTKAHAFPNHNLGKVPPCLAVVGTTMLVGSQPVQVQRFASRSLTLIATSSGFTIEERVTKYFRSDLAALTVRVRVIALDIMQPVTGAPPFDIDMSRALVSFGHGRFRNNGPDVIKAAKSGAGIEFYIPKPGPSMDVDNGALRIVRPNGQATNVGTFTATFAGSGGWPIKI